MHVEHFSGKYELIQTHRDEIDTAWYFIAVYIRTVPVGLIRSRWFHFIDKKFDLLSPYIAYIDGYSMRIRQRVRNNSDRIKWIGVALM